MGAIGNDYWLGFDAKGHDKQGKCSTCRLRFTWRGRPLLKHALCPHCKQPLERTSHEMKRFRHVSEPHPLEVR
jgi:predicted amidophosphoribosyltransferase